MCFLETMVAVQCFMERMVVLGYGLFVV